MLEYVIPAALQNGTAPPPDAIDRVESFFPLTLSKFYLKNGEAISNEQENGTIGLGPHN
jgi:hypothetical protein